MWHVPRAMCHVPLTYEGPTEQLGATAVSWGGNVVITWHIPVRRNSSTVFNWAASVIYVRVSIVYSYQVLVRRIYLFFGLIFFTSSRVLHTVSSTSRCCDKSIDQRAGTAHTTATAYRAQPQQNSRKQRAVQQTAVRVVLPQTHQNAKQYRWQWKRDVPKLSFQTTSKYSKKKPTEYARTAAMGNTGKKCLFF